MLQLQPQNTGIQKLIAHDGKTDLYTYPCKIQIVGHQMLKNFSSLQLNQRNNKNTFVCRLFEITY